MTSPRPFSPLRARLLAVLWLGLCLAPYLVGYGEVGFLSEDFTALVHASELGRAAADLSGPQYGLAQPLFYRPWVTLSLGFEAALCGYVPALLKLSHLLALAVACAALRALARRLGLSETGAILAALLAAWFPFGAGSVLWLVGRVDAHLLGFGLLYLACHARAQRFGEAEVGGGARLRVALVGHLALLLALVTKETAVALAPIALVLEGSRRDAPLRDLRPGARWLRGALRTAPACALTGAFLAWRARCLGTWIGGYAGGELVSGAPIAALAWKPIQLLASLGDLVLLLPLTWLGRDHERTPQLAAAALGLLLLGFAAGAPWRRSPAGAEGTRALRRTALAGALWTLLACAPLLPLFGDPAFATNARAYWLAWCGLALALAARLSALPRRAAVPVAAGALAIALLGLARNVADHVQSSRAVESLRAEIARATRARPGRPVILEDVPKSVGSAYALTFGLREAVREPFAPQACEVAAWRPLFPAAPPLPALPAALRSAFAPGASAAGAAGAGGAPGVGWTRLDGAPPLLSGELAFAWFAEWQALQGAPRGELLARLPALELPGFGPRVRLGFLSALGSASAELALPAEPRAALSLVEIFVLAPILSSGEGALYVPLEVVDKGGDRIWIYAESLDERGAPNGPASELLELRCTPSFGALLRPR
jgi:hypothetical protein